MCTLQLTCPPSLFAQLLEGKTISRIGCLQVKLEVFAGVLAVIDKCETNGGKVTNGRKAIAMGKRALISTSYDEEEGQFCVSFTGGNLSLGMVGSTSDTTRSLYAVWPALSFEGWSAPVGVALRLESDTRRGAQVGTVSADRRVQQP